MNETYYLGAYWGPRREDAQVCAQRTAHLVHLLEPVDSLFARWFKSAKTLKESLKRPLDSDLEGLRKYIQRVVMKDDRRQPMPDVGFHVWLWNGGSGGDDLWLNFLCGGYWEKANNRCVITPPHKGPATERVLTTAFQTAVLHALATAWDPDWGVAMSHAHREIIEKKCPDVLVGWVTYLSRRLGRVPPCPPRCASSRWANWAHSSSSLPSASPPPTPSTSPWQSAFANAWTPPGCSCALAKAPAGTNPSSGGWRQCHPTR